MQPNQRVGEYILDERIAGGPVAEVWRSHHHAWTDQLAAVKVPVNPDYIANLRREGVRMQRLMHPNIVQPLAFDPTGNPPYMVTEYMPGGNLRTLITLRRLNGTAIINILRQVLSALHFAHEKGIVHGDVRPENILMTAEAASSGFAGEGTVKLIDFGVGLAALATPQGQAYLAPEVREGNPADARSDIYAVGVIMFEMLTGERPSGADTPSDLNPEAPAMFNDIFRRSYARRDRRFESAKNFLEALGTAPAAGSSRPAPAQGTSRAPAAPVVPAPAASKRTLKDIMAPPPKLGFAEDAAPLAAAAAPEPEVDLNDGADIGMQPDDSEPMALVDESNESGEESTDSRTDDMLVAPVAPAPAAEAEPESVEQEPAEPPVMDEPDISAPSSPGASRAPGASGSSMANKSRMAAAGDTVLESAAPPPKPAAETVKAEPIIPPIPRTPSRAVPGTLFDELAKQPLRNPAEMKNAFRLYVEARQLDAGEAVNIRLRVVKWANLVAGGKSDLDPHLFLYGALERPLYMMKLLVRTSTGDDPPRAGVVDHAIADQSMAQFRKEDYKLIAHVSAEIIPDKMIETLIAPAPGLRTAMLKLVQAAKQEITGKVVRMDLLLYRAGIIAAAYRFEEKKQRAYLIGSALTVIGNTELFDHIREEPTKRAASLLDTEQVQLGIKELRRGLENARWKAKSTTILSAFRGKLAAAYLGAARAEFNDYGWLESLDISDKALKLVPGQEDALAHTRLVRKRAMQIHMFPGFLVALVFVGLSVLLHYSDSKDPKIVMQNIVTATLFGAGIGALLATLIAAFKLNTRVARTDLTFYHAALLPTAVAAVIALAPTRFENYIGDGICAGVIVLIVVAEIIIFNIFRAQLIRIPRDTSMPSSGLSALDEIDSMLKQDWESIKAYYKDLPGLYTFAGQKMLADVTLESPADLEKAAPSAAGAAKALAKVAAASEAKPTAKPAPVKPKPAAVAASGNKLADQVNQRLSAASRGLSAPARLVATLVEEYAKAVNNHNLGMMQGNAMKIEQKGKDLAERVADFQRLCHAPLSVPGQDAELLKSLTAEFAARAESPDIELLMNFAEQAVTFRHNQTDALAQFTEMMPRVMEAIYRLKTA